MCGLPISFHFLAHKLLKGMVEMVDLLMQKEGGKGPDYLQEPYVHEFC